MSTLTQTLPEGPPWYVRLRNSDTSDRLLLSQRLGNKVAIIATPPPKTLSILSPLVRCTTV